MNKDTHKALGLLAKYHNQYITMAKAISGNNLEVKNYAEDFVQEAYLKLSRYDNLYSKIINKNGTVSKGYMFFTLRSIIINKIKKKSDLKYNYFGYFNSFDEEYELFSEEVSPKIFAESKLDKKLYDVLKSEAKWFDFELLRKYLKNDKSLKTLAKEMNIGIRTVYSAIKRCKLIIAAEMYEDYQDYLNGDYDKISIN